MPKRKLWDADKITKAVEAIRANIIGYKKAAVIDVPRGTLKNYIKNLLKSVEENHFCQ